MPTIIPLTPESAWLQWLASAATLSDWQVPLLPTLVVTPHPDDETLGAGGLIARLRAASVPVTIAALTDGENAYGDEQAPALGKLRVAEQTEALARLNVSPEMIHRLRLPDRDLCHYEELLVTSLRRMVVPGMHLVVPWPADFHPDHEAAGRAAYRVASGFKLPLTYYMFWTWHRGSLSDLDKVPLQKLALTKDEQRLKERALQAHASQLWHMDSQPILSDELLQPARRGFEVYIRS